MTRRPRAGMLLAVRPWRWSSSTAWGCSSNRMVSSGKCSSSPRRGSVLSCSSMSCATEVTPSQVMQANSPRAAATTLSPTTSKRCSSPRTKRSTMTWLPSASATRQAASISAWLFRSRATPLPWLPSLGLMTTGRPMSWAIAQACSGLSTMRPSGMGTPHCASSRLVRSLSREMLSATALVRSVSAVQMRRWCEPWPSCTRLPSVRRMDGMPRWAAASTMLAVLGPRHSRSARALSRLTVAATSKGVSLMAAITKSRAAIKLSWATSYWRARTTTL